LLLRGGLRKVNIATKKFESSEKVLRKGHKKTCAKCGVVGHTKTTCNRQVAFLFSGRDGSWWLILL